MVYWTDSVRKLCPALVVIQLNRCSFIVMNLISSGHDISEDQTLHHPHYPKGLLQINRNEPKVLCPSEFLRL
ncbi:hypothetical protein GDO78_021365, partial [Eleutherodactylus coqui]